MRNRLAKLLAETDDPATIAELLEFADTGQTSPQLSALDGTTLQELYERFLARRRNRSPATRSQYKRTIPTFVDYAKTNDVVTPAGISVGLLDEFVDTLQNTYDTDATILTYTKNVRGWLRWLNRRNYCSERVYRILDKDELGLSPTARDEALPSEQAEIVLTRLRQQRRGSLMHALVELLWNTGPRIGGVHSLDVTDFDAKNNEIRFRHRPSEGTRLKNGSGSDCRVGDGERNVVLQECVVTALEDYLQFERPDITDEYSREPLFVTQYGRAARSTIRRKVYEATSCRWLSEVEGAERCTGNCDPDSDVCWHSYYPHAIRRGAIVHHLSGGLRPDIASERFDVSVSTIRKHYDPRSKRKRKEDRLAHVQASWT